MVFRMELTFSEIGNILDNNYICKSYLGYTLQAGIHEITDINSMLMFLLRDDIEVNSTIDDIGLKSKLTTDKTKQFTKTSFSCTILGFTQSHSLALGDIEGYVQLIPNTYKSDKQGDLTGIDKVHLNVTVSMDLLLMALGNLFHSLLFSFHHPVSKLTKNLESKFSKR